MLNFLTLFKFLLYKVALSLGQDHLELFVYLFKYTAVEKIKKTLEILFCDIVIFCLN